MRLLVHQLQEGVWIAAEAFVARYHRHAVILQDGTCDSILGVVYGKVLLLLLEEEARAGCGCGGRRWGPIGRRRVNGGQRIGVLLRVCHDGEPVAYDVLTGWGLMRS
jgi:hypothetical protein